MLTAHQILANRLASGEITLDEFQRLKDAIGPENSAGFHDSESTPVVSTALVAIKEVSASAATGAQPRPVRLVPMGRHLQFLILALCVLSIASLVELANISMKSALTILSGDVTTRTTQVSTVVELIFMIYFLWWLYFATTNLARANIPLKISPLGAVTSWFIPVLCFWKPYRAMSQLWRASLHGSAWDTYPTPKKFKVWWTLFWACLTIVIAVGYMASQPDIDPYGPAALLFFAGQAIASVIGIAALAILYVLIEKISAAQDERFTAITIERTTRPRYLWPTIAAGGVAALGLFIIGAKDGQMSGSSNWQVEAGRDPISGQSAVKAIGSPTSLSGTSRGPALIIECTGGRPSIAIAYSQPMKDAFPSGDINLVNVTLKVGSSSASTLAFVPSSDWATLSQPNPKAAAFVQGTANIIGNIFGDLVPHAKDLNATWSASGIISAMGTGKTLVTRATGANDIDITASYDLSGFRSAYDAMPSSCRN